MNGATRRWRHGAVPDDDPKGCFSLRAVAVLALLLPFAAGGDQTWLVSSAVPGDTPAGWTQPHALSADGRFALLSSAATTWVSGVVDLNGGPDVYLWDRLTGERLLVSRTAGDAASAADGESHPAALSADGRYVLFYSYGTDLVAGAIDSNGEADVYLWDRLSGGIALVSHTPVGLAVAANGRSTPRALSSDGRFVAFQSLASDLVAGGIDANSSWDAFVWDREDGTVTLASSAAGELATAADGSSEPAALSDDGRYLAFTSTAANLVDGVTDGNGVEDVFLWDRIGGGVRLVSHPSLSLTATANGGSLARAIRTDGGVVAFVSTATDLTPAWNGPAGRANVFVWDAGLDQATLASHAAGDPTQGADEDCEIGAFAPDGSALAFSTTSITLVDGGSDTNELEDVFLWRTATGESTLVSHAASSAAVAGDHRSDPVALSADGRYLLLASSAGDLLAPGTDTNQAPDAFLWDRDTDELRLVSAIPGTPADAGNAGSTPHALSADGEFVALSSYADDLVSDIADENALNDAFLWSRADASTTLISSAAEATRVGGNGAGGAVAALAVSADGRYALFHSDATNLIVGGEDAPGTRDAFLWDRTDATVRLVSHAAGSATAAGNGVSEAVGMTADGRWVIFHSTSSDLVAGVTDANGVADAFQWDRQSQLATLLSAVAGAPAEAADGASRPVATSADGRYVALESRATNLVAGGSDGNGERDVFLWDRDSGAMTLVSHAHGAPLTAANAHAVPTAISDDGRFVAFYSAATNLVAAQSEGNSGDDAFLWDRTTGLVTLVSHAFGAPALTGNGRSVPLALSADGHYVTFASKANDLMPGNDGNGVFDLLQWDRLSGAVTLISHTALSTIATGNEYSAFEAASSDGRFVAFVSAATDMVAGLVDTNGPAADAYLWDRESGAIQLVSHAAGAATTTASGASTPAAMSADGRYVALESNAEDLDADVVDWNFLPDVWVWDRQTDTTVLVSHYQGVPTLSANAPSSAAAMSADGSFVLFLAAATDLVPTSSASIQVYLWSATTLDGAPPQLPQLDATSPPTATWSNAGAVEVSWVGAGDEAGGSGLLGYSLEWNLAPDSIPDALVDEPHAADPNAVTSPALADGDMHYFHLVACDAAGNCSGPVHAGPFWIDTAPPGPAADLTSSSHEVGTPSMDSTIDLLWAAAADQPGLSGISGYALALDASAEWSCDGTPDVGAGTLAATSPPLADGEWYFHLCALDGAGNASVVATLGPFTIDASALVFVDGFESADTLAWSATIP